MSKNGERSDFDSYGRCSIIYYLNVINYLQRNGSHDAQINFNQNNVLAERIILNKLWHSVIIDKRQDRISNKGNK